MKKIKHILFGVLVGIVIGLWLGVNIGRDKPLLSNPFEEKSVQQKLRETGKIMLEKSGETIERGGKSLKEQFSRRPAGK